MTGRAPSRLLGAHSARRGNIVLIVALCLVVLMGFAALVFDVGYMRLVRTQLQMATAATTNAAVKSLDQTAGGLDAARDAALGLAAYQVAGGHSISIDATDVELGYWDEDLETFTADESDPALVSAARITTSVQVPLFLGAVAFANTDYADGFTLTSTTVVTQGEPSGAKSVGCSLPVAIPLCRVDADGDDHIDNASTLQGLIFDAGSCAGTSAGTTYGRQAMLTSNKSVFGKASFSNALSCTTSFEVGDRIYVATDASNLSTTANAVLPSVVTAISANADAWDSALWGSKPNYMASSIAGTAGTTVGAMYAGPIPVVDTSGTPGYCSTTAGVHRYTTADRFYVVGFVWGAIYDVKQHSGTIAITNTACSSTIATNSLHVRIRLDGRESEHLLSDASTGGPDYGVTANGVSRIIPIE